MKSTENSVLNNIDKIHTTTMGFGRIKKNLQLCTDDVVGWCKNKITDKKSLITRKGKNWYVTNDNYVITINAHSYTIITAHVVKPRVDEKLKEEVSEIYENFGIDLPTAIRIFFKKSVSVQGLPFDLRNTDLHETKRRWNIYEQAREIIQEQNSEEMSLAQINNEINATRSESKE